MDGFFSALAKGQHGLQSLFMIHEFTTIVLTHLPFLLLMGAAAGFLAGLLGIGGGIVLVPCLFFGLTWLGYEPAHIMHMSVATAFAANVPTALSSIRAHWKKEAVRTDVIRKIAPGILLGVLTFSSYANLDYKFIVLQYYNNLLKYT